MATTIKINRKWLFHLPAGEPAIDWGAGMAQRLDTGKFVWYTPEGREAGRGDPAPTGDETLEALLASGLITAFDETTISIPAWDSASEY